MGLKDLFGALRSRDVRRTIGLPDSVAPIALKRRVVKRRVVRPGSFRIRPIGRVVSRADARRRFGMVGRGGRR